MDQKCKEEMKTKIRRLPAVLMLIVLCLTVFPVSAFGAGNAEVKIPVSVELSGEIPAQDETYTVKLSALDQAPVPKDDTLKITGEGASAFPAISYSSPGIYGYKISQQAGSHGGGHYDETVYYVRVTVTNAEDGGLEAAVAAHTDAGMTGEKRDIVFQNTYDAVPKLPKQDPPRKPAVKQPADAVRTGDTTHLFLFGSLLGISCLGICLAAGIDHRKRRKERL